MRLMPLMAGAAALGPILGIAISGSINTIPKQSGNDVLSLLDSIPRHPEAPFEATQDASLPDHYPLVTPRGVVQVADLWLHGLYRDRKSPYAYYEYDTDPYGFDNPEDVVHLSNAGGVQDGGHGEAAEHPASDAPVPGQMLETEAAPVPLQVPQPVTGPKIVDVATVLAQR